MGRAAEYLTVAQFDLLKWISDGCQDGVYEGSSYRVSACALHNRGLIQVQGRGATWSAEITRDGTRRLKELAERVEAERQREQTQRDAEEQRERERHRLRQRAVEVLDGVVAAGGRLELGTDIGDVEFKQIENCLAHEGLLPSGQRLTHEPTRMDPDLGITAYLEPDYAALTPMREFKIPKQLRNAHPAVVAFQGKRAYVAKAQIPRAARFLQGLVSASAEMGWKVSNKVPRSHSVHHDEEIPDLTLSLSAGSMAVTIRELDQRGRIGLAFVTDTDYYTRTTTTTANKRFVGSGRLQATVTNGWGQEPTLAVRDTDGATLEEQLPNIVRQLEIAVAEGTWRAQEEVRRAEIRKVRWEEVKKEAFGRLSYQRNSERLRDQLSRRGDAAAMRDYAAEIEHHADQLARSEAEAARQWAQWIREHADHIDPINGQLDVVTVTSCSHTDLQPHMNGWSTYGPHRN